ncbi:carboxypeptidase regulatory-like domain-containing protein [Streptomyces sp. MC1]|uniref:carboxypeptidase regulatory-like domain-containing protein n=1 Tax=Streptomyces sp. MC1 TaxID=295105 RepID=UPI0018CA2431|nr:carboxypeptidase regulatory-like domain-containing protein [Streptomyces sp. MC1]MBG7702404.1 carboxypeptidase regulatory-like domain-containing protein [Streptomyces sp. MC1]
MSGRGRVRAPVSLLIAACLSLFAAAQAPVAAAAPEPATAKAASATGSASADSPAKPPLDVASEQADYRPADCNKPAPDPDTPTARCYALISTESTQRTMSAAAGPAATALTPDDIRSAYDLPDGGKGRTVAIVDAGGYSSAEADLAVFREQFGLPACTTDNGCFRKVDQRGGVDYPADDLGWAEETALDLDAVSSACPACRLLLVEADSAAAYDLGAAVRTAVALGAKYVSNSYGIPGEDPEQATLDAWKQPGVVVTASAGDTANVVNWPASDPDVISVGGTRLTRDTGTARGWTESAWSASGSGCSAYEPRPAYQQDVATSCARRAISDISAVADPHSGLAVYDSLGHSGWLQVGGTSLSAPLVAAMYALAGEPAADTYPVTYPYADQGHHLFDVTEGSSGTCGTVLCDAGKGWDGPTGLGSPNGVTALAMGPHGTATGRVTDTAGAPVPGANVLLTGKEDGRVYHATADAKGAFRAVVAAGAYEASATAFGYADAEHATLTVADGGTGTAGITLRKLPSHTVSGKVTDASGHGWPLYATIAVDGYPGGALHTDPRTGEYSVELPDHASYTLRVTPDQPGYATDTATVALDSRDTRADFPVKADKTMCVAPGYAYPVRADFEGWTGARNGWTVVDHGSSGNAWEFGDPHQQWNFTGGSGDFAAVDPYDNNGTAEDADLLSPVLDLTHETDDHLRFDAGFAHTDGSGADVAFSLDGGSTWTTVFRTGSTDFSGPVDVPLKGALGHPDVRVRFHYSGSGESIFEIDNVSVGSCATLAGGILEGTVTDANTHRPLVGATVSDGAAVTASVATPDNPALSDGFYWLFSPVAGKNTVTTTMPRYKTATAETTITADSVRVHDQALAAGRLSVTGGDITVGAELGRRASREITLKNTGGAPLHVTVGEQNAGGDTTVPAVSGAAPRYVKGVFPDGPATPATPGTARRAAPSGSPTATPATSSGSPWQILPDYPEPIMDNASATFEGKTYSVGGIDKVKNGHWTKNSYVYDPAAATWTPIAPLPVPLESPAAAFVDGTLYVVGGWAAQGTSATAVSTVYAYHPASDTWSRVTDLPTPIAAASTAVLDGRLYVVGGCPDGCDTVGRHVYRYDPASDKWRQLADYPVPVHWAGCAGTSGAVTCAGGVNRSATGHARALKATYVYHPRTDTWTQGADVPYAVWGMAANGGNGRLQIVGGVTDDGATNKALQYDPLGDVWSSLPNAYQPIYRSSGSGCGLGQVGGGVSPSALEFPMGTRAVQNLPGFGQCADDQVTWLTENRTTLDLAPGHSARIRVTADGSAVTTPGTYSGVLSLTTDSPYVNAPVPVKFTVTAPASWAEVTGAVTDAATGTPLAGATVTVHGPGGTTTVLHTDRHGTYDVWRRPGPLTLTAEAAGHRARTVRLTPKRGSRTTVGLALSGA